MKCLLAASLLALTASAAGVQMNGLASSVVAGNTADATFRWTANLGPSSAIGYGVILDGNYFVQAQNTGNQAVTLYSFDASNGSQNWNVSTPSSTGLYVAAGGGNIYAGTLNSLTAYSPADGHVVWTYKTTPDMHSANLSPNWPGKPTYLSGVVYVTWYNTPMVALDATTGAPIFKTPYYVGGRIWTDGEESASGKNTGTNLYFMKQDPMTTKYSSSSAVAATGALRWNFTWDATGNFDTCVANSHGYASRVFTNTNNSWGKNIVGFNKETGNVVWLVNGTDITANGGFDYNIMNDRVCLSYQNTNLTYILACYDIKNGALAWAANLATQDNSINVAAGDDFILVYGFNSGDMWAFDYNGNARFLINKKQPWYGTLHKDTYYFGHYDAQGNAKMSALKI